ncbi:ABC transporter permease [Methanohalophilus portucalensis]|jgi:NitT/TauT family transport system permease protein|uniref:ABC transporter permease n=2 Tax=Methanohalophilus portucalensis TaxID=39664 RepID=A0A1L9C5N4_9EURY|nr:ABC transporter permease [Methanohalophilus portucalensis]ATU08456.1 sulfonate ABC transporter permease [Methanohalophilus portucalensis]OJH49804.1 nitrate/sulfonate/bicarbonate ABC transporter inner membrane protein [Methanohalophilus portucalensis FDF-1]RNI13377.1 ABC transporter permease [Methanohalophilus portucalensis FDF-1]SMH33704.1 NitT/TauT family transport system permease protein [Methanohalophilus portucalensis FDF-1]
MKTKPVSKKGIEIVSLIAVIVIWQLIADFVIGNTFILPSFTDVVYSFITIVERGVLFTDIGISLLHFGIGIISALIVGIPIGIAMGWFQTVDRITDPLIEIVRPIPPLAWIPFAIVWFGLTHQSAGFVVFVGAVFPIIINTVAGFKSVSRVYVEAGKVLGCMKSTSLIRHVALPYSLPSIASGIRIAMGVGWMCLVAAEMFGVSKNGLGYKIWWHYYLHQMDFVLVYMLILGFLGLLIDRIFRWYVDGKLLKWRKGVVV